MPTHCTIDDEGYVLQKGVRIGNLRDADFMATFHRRERKKAASLSNDDWDRSVDSDNVGSLKLDDNFTTGAASNKNKNKKCPMADMDKKRRAIEIDLTSNKKKKKRQQRDQESKKEEESKREVVFQENPETPRGFEILTQRSPDTVATGDLTDMPDDEMMEQAAKAVAQVIDKRIGNNAEAFLEKTKWNKSIRDPIVRNVREHREALEASIVPKLDILLEKVTQLERRAESIEATVNSMYTSTSDHQEFVHDNIRSMVTNVNSTMDSMMAVNTHVHETYEKCSATHENVKRIGNYFSGKVSDTAKRVRSMERYMSDIVGGMGMSRMMVRRAALGVTFRPLWKWLRF